MAQALTREQLAADIAQVRSWLWLAMTEHEYWTARQLETSAQAGAAFDGHSAAWLDVEADRYARAATHWLMKTYVYRNLLRALEMRASECAPAPRPYDSQVDRFTDWSTLLPGRADGGESEVL